MAAHCIVRGQSAPAAAIRVNDAELVLGLRFEDLADKDDLSLWGGARGCGCAWLWGANGWGGLCRRTGGEDQRGRGWFCVGAHPGEKKRGDCQGAAAERQGCQEDKDGFFLIRHGRYPVSLDFVQ